MRPKVSKLLAAPLVFVDAGAAASCTILDPILAPGFGFGLLGWDKAGAGVNK